jgi:hypothetical protein
MKQKRAAGTVNLHVPAAVAAAIGTLTVPAPASAVTITDLFVFGDSYSDTGAFFPLTNGSTAVGYLAKNFNITLTTSKNPDHGTEGINFSGKRRSYRRRSHPAGHATEKPHPAGRGVQELRYLQLGDV